MTLPFDYQCACASPQSSAALPFLIDFAPHQQVFMALLSFAFLNVFTGVCLMWVVFLFLFFLVTFTSQGLFGVFLLITDDN